MRTLFILICVLSAVLVLPSFMSETYAQQTTGDTESTIEYLVTAETANLRAQPSTTAAIVDTAKRGDSLQIYDEEPEAPGWLRIRLDETTDAYIADFLVERAPTRFYSVEQDPILSAAGHGKTVTDVFDIPGGAYRIDAVVADNAFILSTVTVEGDCRDRTVLNELSFDTNQLIMSALFVSSGCSVIFETDNVDGDWSFEIRDILDIDYSLSKALQIDDGTELQGTGRALTMSTVLPEGVWQITAIVEDNAFILNAHPTSRDCEESGILNEFDMNASSLEVSTIYRSGGCIIFWETSNVDAAWTISFAKIR